MITNVLKFFNIIWNKFYYKSSKLIKTDEEIQPSYFQHLTTNKYNIGIRNSVTTYKQNEITTLISSASKPNRTLKLNNNFISQVTFSYNEPINNK